MARQPRRHVVGGLYHVTLRGNHRQDIFQESLDRDLLAELVADSLHRHDCQAHAYCWMTNHIHLAVRIGETPLGPFVQHFASRYARMVQRRLRTTGHLFERRYRASLADTDEYLMALIRYIHLNPVRAGMVIDPVDYAWSSHRAYLGLARVEWLTLGLGLELFDTDPGAARAAYHRFMMATPDADETARIREGNAIGARTEAVPATGAAQTAPRGIPNRAQRLESLILAMATDLGVPATQLAGPSRARRLSHARAVIAKRALQAKLATLTELGVRFGRTPAALWQGIQRYCRVG